MATESKQLFKDLEKTIKRLFGKRCCKHYWACTCCIVWDHYDRLKEAIMEEEKYESQRSQ